MSVTDLNNGVVAEDSNGQSSAKTKSALKSSRSWQRLNNGNNNNVGVPNGDEKEPVKKVSTSSNEIVANNNNNCIDRQQRKRLGFARKSQSVCDLLKLKNKSSSGSALAVEAGGSASAVSIEQRKRAGRRNVEATAELLINRQQQRRGSSTTTGLATSVVDSSSKEMEPLEGNGARHLAHRERRFRRLFRNVPTTETLLHRFSCAYVSDLGLLIQGHMYISNNWICFHSNIFGIEKIIEIPVETVITVSKAHTAKIIPNAVKIKTQGKYYLFGSLISRDNTYRLLVNVTAGCQPQQSHELAIVDMPDEKVLGRIVTVKISDPLRNNDGEVSSISSSCSSDCSDSSSLADHPQSNVAEDYDNRKRQLNGRDDVDCHRKLHNSDTAYDKVLPKMSFHALTAWFLRLIFLFLCATLLTMRLIYVRRILPSDFVSRSSSSQLPWSYSSLDKMGTTVDDTIKMMEQIRQHLQHLKEDLRDRLLESQSLSAMFGSSFQSASGDVSEKV